MGKEANTWELNGWIWKILNCGWESYMKWPWTIQSLSINLHKISCDKLGVAPRSNQVIILESSEDDATQAHGASARVSRWRCNWYILWIYLFYVFFIIYEVFHLYHYHNQFLPFLEKKLFEAGSSLNCLCCFMIVLNFLDAYSWYAYFIFFL